MESERIYPPPPVRLWDEGEDIIPFQHRVDSSGIKFSGTHAYLKCPFYMYCGDATQAKFVKIYNKPNGGEETELVFGTHWIWGGTGIENGQSIFQDNVELLSVVSDSEYRVKYIERTTEVTPEFALSRLDGGNVRNKLPSRRFTDGSNGTHYYAISEYTRNSSYSHTVGYINEIGGTKAVIYNFPDMLYSKAFDLNEAMGDWFIEVRRKGNTNSHHSATQKSGSQSGFPPFKQEITTNNYAFPETGSNGYPSSSAKSKGIYKFRLRNRETNARTEFWDRELSFHLLTIKKNTQDSMNRFLGRILIPRIR